MVIWDQVKQIYFLTPKFFFSQGWSTDDSFGMLLLENANLISFSFTINVMFKTFLDQALICHSSFFETLTLFSGLCFQSFGCTIISCKSSWPGIRGWLHEFLVILHKLYGSLHVHLCVGSFLKGSVTLTPQKVKNHCYPLSLKWWFSYYYHQGRLFILILERLSDIISLF